MLTSSRSVRQVSFIIVAEKAVHLQASFHFLCPNMGTHFPHHPMLRYDCPWLWSGFGMYQVHTKMSITLFFTVTHLKYYHIWCQQNIQHVKSSTCTISKGPLTWQEPRHFYPFLVFIHKNILDRCLMAFRGNHRIINPFKVRGLTPVPLSHKILHMSFCKLLSIFCTLNWAIKTPDVILFVAWSKTNWSWLFTYVFFWLFMGLMREHLLQKWAISLQLQQKMHSIDLIWRLTLDVL